jgi:endonuclease VIII
MPEGDTIYRTATVLRRALLGGVVRLECPQPGPGITRVPRLEGIIGRPVVTVEARCKHLLIGFTGGLWLRTHMRMNGAWHRYRPGERWRLPRARAVCLLATDSAVAVCFDAPEVELLTGADMARHDRLRTLGPDLLGSPFDADEALRRLLASPERPLGEALLDQRVVAGIGNAVKTEVCFIERVDPWSPVGSFEPDRLRALLLTARLLLQANTGGGRRVTTGVARPGQSVWVYRLVGLPCRRCGTLILARRQGEQARTTYWCPYCQKAPEKPSISKR